MIISQSYYSIVRSSDRKRKEVNCICSASSGTHNDVFITWSRACSDLRKECFDIVQHNNQAVLAALLVLFGASIKAIQTEEKNAP